MERYTNTFADMQIQERLQRSDNILLKLDKLVDWEPINKILKQADFRNNNHKGRDCYSPETIFRIFIVQKYYNISDRDIEDQLLVNILFLTFCKMSLSSRIPDHSTLSRWRNRLNKFNLYESLFDAINDQLEANGVTIRNGACIDATFVASAARPRRKDEISVEPVGDEELPSIIEREDNQSALVVAVPETEPQVIRTKQESVDPDAAWSKKGKQYYYGYKEMITTNFDGFISGVTTVPANVPDIKLAEQSILKAKLKPLFPCAGDKAFDSKEFVDFLGEQKLFNFIMKKKKKNQPDDDFRAKRNKMISKVRYVVERTHGYMKLKLGGARSRYIGLQKTHNSYVMKAIIYNLIRYVNLPPGDSCALLPEMT